MTARKGLRKNLKRPSRKASLKSVKKPAVVHRRTTFCMICKRNFLSKKILENHNTKHHFLRCCPNCPKTFRQTRKFMLHLQSHLADHPYECKICLVSFNQKEDWLMHKKNPHEKTGRFYCEFCPEVFPTLFSRNRHHLAHSGPPYVCVDCNAVFSNVPDMTVHQKNHVHRCFLCPNEVVAFPLATDLVNHFFEAHRPKRHNRDEIGAADPPCISTGAVKLEDDGDSDSMDDLLSSSDDESGTDIVRDYDIDAVEPVYNLKRKDKFICFICYDLYPSCELLKSHMKAHKWYPCNFCPKFFAFSHELEKHKCNFVKVPFICENCNMECENCKKEDISDKVNTPRFPGMPQFPIYDVTNRYKLRNFIHSIKVQKIISRHPIDAVSMIHIGAHLANLKIILQYPQIRDQFPKETIPDLEDLYSNFLELNQILCSGMNREHINESL